LIYEVPDITTLIENKMSSDRATVIWSTVYREGALSGTCNYKGQLCWFELEDSEIEPTRKRKFGIYALDEEGQKLITEEHENFRQHSGYHNDHDPTTYRLYMETNKNESTIYTFSVDTKELRKERVALLPVSQMDRYELPDDPFECEPIDPAITKLLEGMGSYDDFEKYMSNGGTF